MKKILKYLQDQAVTASPVRALGEKKHDSGGSEPTDYILRRINEEEEEEAAAGTKDGEVQPCSGTGDLARVRTLDHHQAAANAVIAAGIQKHQYAADSVLQGYDEYIPDGPSGLTIEEERERVWVVFIHGGFWCDPQQIAWTFTATRAMLLMHPSLRDTAKYIAGYASINYRLSAHLDFPQDSRTTSDYEMRNAKHPDHVNDVLSALRDLQKRHGFKERYLLCGHSCGATLAMQVAMGRRWTNAGPVPLSTPREERAGDVVPPMAILGIDGIYDIPLLRDTYKGVAMYQNMFEGAFGPDESVWAAASPARWHRYAETFSDGRLVILAHSREDELVDWGQVEAMDRCWKEQSGTHKGVAKILEIRGKHAEIWQKGVGMAGPIREAINLMHEQRKE